MTRYLFSPSPKRRNHPDDWKEFDKIEIYPLGWLQDTMMVIYYKKYPQGTVVQVDPKVHKSRIIFTNLQGIICLFPSDSKCPEIRTSSNVVLCKELKSQLEMEVLKNIHENT